MMKDNSISILVGGSRKLRWSPDNHSRFSEHFRSRVFTFVMCVRRYFARTKVPKYILFEIISLENNLRQLGPGFECRKESFSPKKRKEL